MVKKDGAQALVEAGKLLDKFLADPAAEPFREPVPWKQWELYDYPKIVKEPMDLGTVKKNLKTKKYKPDLKEFARHVKLVWTNCMAFNADKSEFHKLASKLDKKFERELKKLQKSLGLIAPAATNGGGAGGGGHAIASSSSSSSSSGKGPTAEEKASFCRMIYDINEIHLGEVIETLDNECALAIDKTGTDEIEINVDAIDLSTFRKLEITVRDFLSKEKNKKKPVVVQTPAALQQPTAAAVSAAAPASSTTSTTKSTSAAVAAAAAAQPPPSTTTTTTAAVAAAPPATKPGVSMPPPASTKSAITTKTTTAPAANAAAATAAAAKPAGNNDSSKMDVSEDGAAPTPAAVTNNTSNGSGEAALQNENGKRRAPESATPIGQNAAAKVNGAAAADTDAATQQPAVKRHKPDEVNKTEAPGVAAVAAAAPASAPVPAAAAAAGGTDRKSVV